MAAVFIGSVVYKIERKNADAALAGIKAEADHESAVENAEKEKHDRLQQYLIDTNFPFFDKEFNRIERSIEIIESGNDSKIKRTYSMSYISQNCLLIKRDVRIDSVSGETADLLKKYEDCKTAINLLGQDNPASKTIQTSLDDVNLQLKREGWNRYVQEVENESTEFRILKNEDELHKWIEKYKKWCQTVQTEHLVSGVTNNISKCCTGQSNHTFGDPSIEEDNFSDVNFVTPNYLMIGDGQWTDKEVVNLEKLLAMIPDLDANVKKPRHRRQTSKMSWPIKTCCVLMKKTELNPSLNKAELFYGFGIVSFSSVFHP